MIKQEKVREMEPAARFPQHIAAIIANIGAFIFGVSLGWTSPVAHPLKKDEQYGFPVSKSQFSLIGSLMPIGAFFAAPIAGWMVTSFGRKSTMMMFCVPAIIGYALMAWAQDVPMFYIGRVFTGISTGGFAVVVPMYTSELAETQIRGTLGSYFQLQLNTGILFTYIVGSITNVFWLTLLCMLVPILYGVLMVFLPESPIYYLEKNRVREAKQALQWFRGSRYSVEGEFQLMQHNINQQMAGKLSFLEAFSTKAAKKGLIINLGLMAFQQLSGFNSVIFYTTIIFEAAGTKLDANVETIITGTVAVVVTFGSTLAVDRLGRRPLLLVSDSLMALCTFVIGLYFFLMNRNYSVDSFAWVPLCFVCIFLISFAFGFGPVPWIFMSEVFPRQITGYAVSMVCSFNFLCVFLVTRFFEDVSSAIGLGGSFFVFTILSSIGTVFVYFIVPETKNKTLEEVIKELEE